MAEEKKRPTRDEAIKAAAGNYANWLAAWKQKPEGLTDAEWEIYQNCDPQKIDPRIRAKVEAAMGWKPDDVAAAEEIAEKVGEWVHKLDQEAPPILARLRAALRLLENEHITPQGRRIIEKILDEYE